MMKTEMMMMTNIKIKIKIKNDRGNSFHINTHDIKKQFNDKDDN